MKDFKKGQRYVGFKDCSALFCYIFLIKQIQWNINLPSNLKSVYVKYDLTTFTGFTNANLRQTSTKHTSVLKIFLPVFLITFCLNKYNGISIFPQI